MVRDAEETVSALVDGELDGIELKQALNMLRENPELQARWSRYHVVKDALTNNLTSTTPLFINDRIMDALRDEPLIFLPAKARADTKTRPWLKQVAGLAVAASVTAVAIIGVQRLDRPEAQPSLIAEQEPEQTQEATLVADQKAGSEEQLRLEPYIVNHNEYSDSSAMQGMLPYVRLVGHENEQ